MSVSVCEQTPSQLNRCICALLDKEQFAENTSIKKRNPM